MLEQQLHFIRKYRRGTAVLLILFCVSIAAAALLYFKLLPLPFRNLSFQEGELLDLVMSLSVMAIFMERAVEAILVPVRTPDRQEIEHEIQMLRSALKQKAEGEEKQALSLEVHTKEHELEKYRLKTARCAYKLSFVLGIAISLVGIRALGGLIDQDVLNALEYPQWMLFSLVDIVITGGVISGGSAAIDKIGRSISKSLHLTSATTSTLKDDKKEDSLPQNGSEGA